MVRVPVLGAGVEAPRLSVASSREHHIAQTLSSTQLIIVRATAIKWAPRLLLRFRVGTHAGGNCWCDWPFAELARVNANHISSGGRRPVPTHHTEPAAYTKKREVHCKLLFQYSEPGSNRHGHYWPQDFKSGVSTYSTIRATQPLRRCKCSVFILFCQIFCAFLRYIVAFSCCAPACRNYLGDRRARGCQSLGAKHALYDAVAILW